MKVIIFESIILCLLFTVVFAAGKQRDPLSGLHNLPIAIQQRVHCLPEYQNRKTEVMNTRQRIIKKIPALIVITLIFLGLVALSGASTFSKGFLYSFMLWTVVKLYVVFVLNCLWYAHSPKYWIKGTEDLNKDYQNYKFYIGSIPRSLLAGCAASVLIGFGVMLIRQGGWM